MIIGNGLLAQAFSSAFSTEHNLIVFASGVANSRETRPEQFARERALLESALDQDKFMVYFSTCSIHDVELAASPYVLHKQAMEELILERATQKAIFRLPQVVGHTPNPNTLTNYLYRQIKDGTPFQIWRHARRNLIDVDDIAAIICQLVRSHQADGVITNIASPASIAIPDLVAVFESLLDKRGHYEIVEAGASYEIDVALAMATAQAAGIVFDQHYVTHLIRKYYA